MTQIRISYVRATFAAGLLGGVRSSLLKVTDLFEAEHDRARSTHHRDVAAEPEPIETSLFVAAALFAEWIADTLHRQIAFYFELDRRLASTFEGPELPPTEATPEAPPEWPQPALPESLRYIPNLVADNGESRDTPVLRDRAAAQMRDIVEDLDDAIRAIDSARNVRFQAQIADAAVQLRDWVVASATTLGPRR